MLNTTKLGPWNPDRIIKNIVKELYHKEILYRTMKSYQKIQCLPVCIAVSLGKFPNMIILNFTKLGHWKTVLRLL